METNKRWIDLYPEEISPTIEYENISLGGILQKISSLYPNNNAISFFGSRINYFDLYKKTLRFSQYLSSIGVKKGDKVAIMLPNCPQAVISFFSTLILGAIVVEINPLYTEREIQFHLVDSESSVIIVLDSLVNKVDAIKDSTGVKNVITTSIDEYFPIYLKVLYKIKTLNSEKYGRDEHIKFQSALKLGKAIEPNVEINPLKDLALLQYTGGTTGVPKGVMLTHYNLIANTRQCNEWLYECKTGEERVLCILPFFHVFGLTTGMLLCVSQAYEMILLPRFQIKEVLNTITKSKPTLFPGTPTMYIALLNTKDLQKYNLNSINVCVSGSAPLPVEVQEQFEKVTGGKIIEGYGLTEASPVTHANLPWGIRKKGSIGLPWPDVETKIISLNDNQECNVGEVGELWVKGPQVMQGYWKNEDETNAVLNKGWLNTGDLAYEDEEGFFYIVGRKKDMIIASGFNVYPREIEEVLYEHPQVKEATVIGIPDPYRGETVKAFIVLKETEECSVDELDNYCRKYLASYKVPKQYEFRSELPKTAVGKILRRSLVDEEINKLKK
jgi:long-chain acyl-CoA synthetase